MRVVKVVFLLLSLSKGVRVDTAMCSQGPGCIVLVELYRVSQRKSWAFEGLLHHIEPLDYRELNFSVQPRV